MADAPNPRTWVDGEIPPYSTIDTEVYGTIAWLLQPPMVKLRQTTGQVLHNATYVALTWQAEDIDPYNWHSTTNPSRVTPTIPGWYRGWYGIGFTTTINGDYRVGIVAKNGTAIRSRRDAKTPSIGQNKSPRGIPFFVACNGTTDYLEVLAYQDSGAGMTTVVTPALNSEFFMRWWAPL